MKLFAGFVFIVFCIFSFHCKNAGESVLFDVPLGSYAYFGYDSSSSLVAKGWFKFEYNDSINIKGNWEFNKIGISGNVGPQDGKGELVGTITDTLINLNLHPNNADNNIILIGKVQNKYIYGKWQWVTFSGITNWGNFNSRKN